VTGQQRFPLLSGLQEQNLWYQTWREFSCSKLCNVMYRGHVIWSQACHYYSDATKSACEKY